jgi:hypothetical protein
MKRFFFALGSCSVLLVGLSFLLYTPTKAKENVLLVLLDMPAPAPPNPLSAGTRVRDKKFYDKLTPPGDDASIEEILDYWRTMSDGYTELGFNPQPSDKTLGRIMDEIETDHAKLINYLNILPDDERSQNFVKGIYDHEGTSGVFDKDTRATVKNWLKYHTPLFSDELAETANAVADTDQYVSNQTELLALARVDFARAQPIVDRLYNDPQSRASKVAATWARYRHALDTDSIGDIDRYREELKAVVEDKKASPGMRDLALDAISKEKEWSGRDDWYFSLLGDETLADLKVNGQTFTGLTTLMFYAPDGKYTEKMLELLKSNDPVVRAAAVRNLLVKIDSANPEVIRAMVPWLEDPKWANDAGGSRSTIVTKLGEIEIPESVPGLIKVLNEGQRGTDPAYVANIVANTAYAKPANTNANRAAANSNTVLRTPDGEEYTIVTTYPLRSPAVVALAKQKDPRAVPSLKRVLPEMEYYEQGSVVRALIACNGFTVQEQVDGLELWAKNTRAEMDGHPAVDPLANMYNYANAANTALPNHRAPSALELRAMIGRELMNSTEVPDEVARGAVDRIATLDTTNKPLSEVFRKIVMKWPNAAINLLLLNDLKRGVAESESIVRLLAERKNLREKQPTDVSEIKTGVPVAIGVVPCLLDDPQDGATILENGDTESKIALLACARLVRLSLPVDKVAANLSSPTPLLVTAAERYLESEDSPAARSIVLSRHPGQAKILGATTGFFANDAAETSSEMLYALFLSMGDASMYNGWSGSSNDPEIRKVEVQLQDELKKTDDLVAVYAYDKNYVRIYKNKVLFSWDEDDARYRERPLAKHEFEEIKAFIVENKLDEMPPFLTCGGAYCMAKELVMVGKNGGRRVYVNGETPAVFAHLEKLFDGLKKTPGTLRYALSRDIPGLEIIIASDDLHAETVWKEGSDLRIAASLTAVRKKVEEDVDKISDEPDPSNGTVDVETRKQKVRDKRQYEGFGWYRVTTDGAEPNAPQPAGVEFIPIRDGLAVPAGDEQWKTRAPGFEVRSADDGLFKVVHGRLSKIRSGDYAYPLVTPNGRWVVATKNDPRAGARIVRIDLLTNKEYPIVLEEQGYLYPSVYVPTINRVLLSMDTNYYTGEYDTDLADDNVPDDSDPDQMKLIDPATGAIQPIAGEFRPLDQQTFRPLQSTGKPNEFWAAMPDSEKNQTRVGIYETNTFGFTPVLTVPKIRFNSMSMWVDQPGGKLYFVYRGHLLALPLKR